VPGGGTPGSEVPPPGTVAYRPGMSLEDMALEVLAPS